MGARSAIGGANRVVVKVGTALLTGGHDRLDRAFMHDLAAEAAVAMDSGRRVLLVSSGAVGAGLREIGAASRPADMSELQAAAAAGQPLLMDAWREAFSVRGLSVAQLLVGRVDFDARDRFLNIRNCVSCLEGHGIVPIVNENDSVATEEISLGDNDVLAAKFACAVRADALVILTTVEGVLDSAGARIARVDDPGTLLDHVRAEQSAQGRGGMATKVEAARIAALSGLPTVIALGRPPGNLRGVLAGEDIGTFVSGSDARHAGRRQWIALTATPSGTVDIDEGAARAVCGRGASLLAKGVIGVTGRFNAGDVVVVRDHHGREIARGLTNFAAEELRIVKGRDSGQFEALLGRRTHEELIHRDNLALTGG